MGSNQNLKAYVRYDGSNRVVAGSLIFRRKKPKVGKWHEIAISECCEYIPPTTTTTSTSTSTSTTTTTIAPTPTSYLRLNGTYANPGEACSSWSGGSYSTVYAAESNIGSVTALYTDSGLTNPVPSTNGDYTSIAVPSGPSYTNTHSLIVGSAGLVSALAAC